jgi:hypothetical protein
LPRVLSLAALELCVKGFATFRGGVLVDAYTIFPVNIEVSIPDIKPTVRTGSSCGREGQSSDAGSRSLSGIFFLAALELSIVGFASNGGRVLVDAFTICEVCIVVGVPNLVAAVRTGSSCGRAWQFGNTGSRGLISIFCLAALQLSVVSHGINGSRDIVDTAGILMGSVTVSIPDIIAIGRTGCCRGGIGEHAVALARRLALADEILLATLKLGGFAWHAPGITIVGGAVARLEVVSVLRVVEHGKVAHGISTEGSASRSEVDCGEGEVREFHFDEGVISR